MGRTGPRAANRGGGTLAIPATDRDPSQRRNGETPGTPDGAAESARRITLSNGITLRVRAVPRGALRRAIDAVTIDADPTDDADPTELHSNRIMAVARVLLLLGTEFDAAPPGTMAPADDGWVEQLALAGVPIDPNPGARYREWVESYALAEQRDLAAVIRAVTEACGYLEREVIQAVEYFMPGELARATAQPRPAARRRKS